MGTIISQSGAWLNLNAELCCKCNTQNITSLVRPSYLLCLACSVVPEGANSMKDLPTREVKAVSDNDVAVSQRGRSGFRPNSWLQSGPGRFQDRFRNSSLVQVHVLWDGVDDNISLWTKTTELNRNIRTTTEANGYLTNQKGSHVWSIPPIYMTEIHQKLCRKLIKKLITVLLYIKT